MRLQSRILWLFVLVGHATVATAALLALPGGFPLRHASYWANRVLPIGLIVVVLLALIAARHGRRDLTRLTLFALISLHVGVAAACLVFFPISGRLPAVVATVAAGVTALSVRERSLALPALRRLTIVPSLLIGLLLGVATVAALRSPAATTHPSSAAVVIDSATLSAAESPSRAVIRLPHGVDVHPGDGTLDVSHGKQLLRVEPLLTFTSRSPDRFWTCFAPRTQREGTLRRLLTRDVTATDVETTYLDDGTSTLDVRVLEADTDAAAAIEVNTTSVLRTPIYSHLNTYLQLHAAGHRKLSIGFSPCADERFDISPQDTAPACFAYLDAADVFHVVRARSHEKGPFTSLASGRLRRGEALTITLFDENEPTFEITLHDWSAQASTAPSPTAGWGVPQNAIDFSLNGESPRSPASLFITLAATSVGRGFDSVGHAAGTYANRLSIRRLGKVD